MPKEKSRRRPAKPIEVVMTREEAESRGAILMSCKEAGFEIGVSKDMVIYWAARGYLTKYYVFGNNYNYEVDLREVEIQPELGYERKRVLYNTDWASIPRDSKGAKWVKKSEVPRGV